jgi:lipopolysaccharide assembly protein A
MESRTHRGASPLPGERPKKDRSWRFYAAIVVAVVALVFIVQNSQEVEVDFIVATTSTPLFFVLIITFALGALAGWLWPHVRRDRRRQREGERH